ncbi:M1 family metallopeptidase [Tunicatimonas pelagia]|uniref:M1 family metallopeptidase n=1 Tax=Tunicatimonas pelagia TaxID=931531 RepID=UPI002666DEFC|nr:M1 family metallopeptidase [Tunicatimonas pelagia]WKN42239.1 M1 family metallopeptidase [Tunicatimonas pelagia]
MKPTSSVSIRQIVVIGLCISTVGFSACKVEQIAATQPTNIDNPNVESDSVATELLLEMEEVVALPYQAAEAREHDLLHTKLEVRFDWDKHYLHGKATLQLKPYFYPQSTVNLDAKGFDIHAVHLLKGDPSQPQPLSYEYDSLILQIALDKTYSRDESYLLVIDYTAKPDEFEAGGSEAIKSDKGLYFIDEPSPQIWTQGETEASSRWFPTIDTPNERCTQEMFITVDNRYVTLSNGTLVYSQVDEESEPVPLRTDYWKMDQPHAPYLFMMAVGEFAVVEDQWNEMSVNYYIDSAYAAYADDIFGRTPEMLSFFSEKLGVKYPWSKYAQVIVQDFVSGAMENTTASVFYDALLVDDRELLDNHWDDIIAHELFHHWFGDLVTCESWANLPLNESFATYSEYLWSEHYYGKDEAEYDRWEKLQNYLSEAEGKKVDLIRYRYADKEDMFDRHSYDKGSLILHMLRNYVGDEAFFAALELYLTRHAYTSVEIHDLRIAFEEVTGQDLNWFFNQWFLNSGHPVFDIQQGFGDGQLTLTITQLQDTETAPIYQIPITVDVWVNDKRSSYELWINEPYQEFTIAADTTPQLVLFDAEGALLAEVYHNKSEEEWAYQFRNTNHFMHQLTSLQTLVNDSTATVTPVILTEALDDDFWMIRRLAINALEDQLSGSDSTLLLKIERLARNDEKSLLRADAINALATINAEHYQNLFQQALQDSSYAVIGTAIAAYAKTSAPDKSARFAPFQAFTNFNTVMALADYFVSEGVAGQYPWFEEKTAQVSDETLYYFLNYLAQYLVATNDPSSTQQGIQLLADRARNHPQYYIRLTAYRGLLFFSDQPEVNEMLQTIRDAEQDERLKALYQSSGY